MLTSRFRKPLLSPRAIDRPRLRERLARHAYRPMVLVCAPAGYGKTVLVCQWLEQYTGAYTWLSLDEGLDDLPTFLSYFVEAIARALPGSLPKTKKLLQSTPFLTVEAISEELANEVHELQEHLVVVLDDYHLITDPDIHLTINTLLHYPSERLQLVVISRRDPPLRTKRLRLYGDMLEIRMRDLAFVQKEFQALLSRNKQTWPKSDEQESLLHWTEGWVLGIEMALMSLTEDMGNLDKIKNSFFLRNTDLVVDQLADQLPRHFFQLVKIASLCFRFNETLLDALFKLDGKPSMTAAAFLEKLKAQNLFLVEEKGEETWYRFHHVFQDLIRDRFFREDPDQCRHILLSASDWCSNRGAIGLAIDYAIRAKNYDRACDLISEHRITMLAQDRWWEVRKWLNQIPENIRKQKAGLLLARIWILEYLWRSQDIPYLLDVLETCLANDPDPRLRSEFLFHKGFHHTFILADGKGALPLLEESKALFPDTSSFGARRELPLATARQMVGKSELALQSLDQLEKEHPLLSYMHLRIGLSRTFVHLLDGRMEQADQASARYLFSAGNSGLKTMEAFGWCVRANVLFQALHVVEFSYLWEKMRASWGTMDFWAYFDAMAGFIVSQYLADPEQDLDDSLRFMQRQAQQMKAPFFKRLAESTGHRLSWLMGKGASALRWAEGEKKFPLPRRILFTMEVPELTRIRILVTHGNPQQVAYGLRWLKRIMDFLEQIHNRYHDVDLNLLEAIAHWRSENTSLAIAGLRKAEHLAIERNYIRPLAELRYAVPELWRLVDAEALPTLPLATAAHDSGAPPQPRPLELMERNAREPLTAREKEIAQLVVQGLRNKEVAAQLHISLATVKSHLSRIFRKLDVPNRTHLVLKVKQTESPR